MKSKLFILCLLSYFLSGYVLADDSTVIKPPQVTAVQSKMIQVLHLAHNVKIKDATPAEFPCPTGSARLSSKFFATQTNSSFYTEDAGYYFFICNESNTNNYSYYQSLDNAVWVLCQPASSNPSYCTTKASAPPYIRLVMTIPKMDRRGDGTEEILSVTRAELLLSNASAGITTKSYGSNPINGPVIYTWKFDSNFPPAFPSSNYNGTISWGIRGFVSSGNPWDTSKDKNYYCGYFYDPSYVGFPLFISQNTFGKTVLLSCSGYWYWVNLPTSGNQKIFFSNVPEVAVIE